MIRRTLLCLVLYAFTAYVGVGLGLVAAGAVDALLEAVEPDLCPAGPECSSRAVEVVPR